MMIEVVPVINVHDVNSVNKGANNVINVKPKNKKPVYAHIQKDGHVVMNKLPQTNIESAQATNFAFFGLILAIIAIVQLFCVKRV